jgi:hypothetical protein
VNSVARFLLIAGAVIAADTVLAADPGPKPSTPDAQPAAPAATQSPAPAEPAVNTSATAKPQTKPAAADGKRFKTIDKMQLDATAVTGNRELPKVLYIVPWKRSDLGDLVGKPMNSLVDEVLAPVDRDVFKRQLRYYQALKPDRPAGSEPVEAKPEK